MELENLNGKIIGVISDDYIDNKYDNKLVKDIILKKPVDALKMVGLSEDVLGLNFDDLSTSLKSKIILASKLQDKVIILVDFSKGLTLKEIDNFKRLFKRIVAYGRKIVLVDKNSYMFLDCVDNIYVINKENIVYTTDDIYSDELEKYIDVPNIVEFIKYCGKKGININHYDEIDELLKAIYRIKS